MTPTEAPTSPRARAEPERREPGGRGARLLAAGVCMALVAMILARFPGVVEAWYARTLGPPVARGLSLLTGWIPFSVAALLFALLVGALAHRSVLGFRRLQAGAPLPRVLRTGLDRVAGVVGTLLLLFYPLWGLNYARAPIDQRLGIVSDEAIDRDELMELTRLAVERTSEAYREIHEGSSDVGAPTADLADPVAISRALEVGWRRVAHALAMGETAERAYGPVKTLGVTSLIDALDVAGIYVPYTGEANVSGAQPDLSFPAVAAHEQAHQRGLARENEATFAGLVAAVHADDPLSRYSGWARVLRTVRWDLVRVDPEAWQELGSALIPGVLRDWRDYNDYLRESRSPAGAVATATNDAYLRAHGVPGGVESYGRVTTLLLQWARRHDGDLILPSERRR